MTSNGLILGIETSCDDTAVGLVDERGQVVASAVASQVLIHNRYGGVYPEVASRAHIDKIIPTVRMVLEDSGVNPRELEAIGVTRGPGLIGSLMVGLDTASGLAAGWNVPIVGVNHLRGHLRSADLEEQRVEFPAMILLVSGGHTLLARMNGPSDIKLIGNTLDDSVGEAYDKVSRMLGLGYPGGPVVDRMAGAGIPNIPFPRPVINHGLDFSFSGLKSAVMRYLEAEKGWKVEDVAASFVAACMDVLIAKCRRALAAYPSSSLVIVGGVAASPPLRAAAAQLCDEAGVRLCLPPLKWSTDNGAMIAMAAWDYLASDNHTPVQPQTSLTIESF
ncbi:MULTISPECIES: tRNA (adenosine(37)-N6)-threonylcarbamoyltransferase complex transferase subunit TsaD [Catenuloplanes]|uniref:tRNA N6-adenosine threonylcarbamoyltransferase n=1 Tax=Catenuloplanes niger TaxID=587534 RepID=A0AAE3ZTV3_9ACTN|nr:tRNA (adenosine(37)-N6)-threonylcarbamoyltransferase complex transferase subunit TsaD [Catenuloplanes niger]MDR7324650.1 N6-L-threonylcarbamoyladenine synthase [Catenuloplanes niger]